MAFLAAARRLVPGLLAGVLLVVVLASAVAGEARDPLWWKLPWDVRMGVSWFEVRAARGDVDAQAQLGQMYERGIGTDKDLREAARWYRKAGAQGFAPAQYRLARLLETGALGAVDLQAAARWYAKAAENGIPEADFRLGAMTENGQGVPRDPARAGALYERAFAGGLAEAALARGLLALNSESDPLGAYVWLRRAERADVATAGALARDLRELLDDKQLAEAERRAAEPLP